MQPTCGTWSDCGIIGGGCCTDPELSKADPRPSLGSCNRCRKNPGRGRPMPALIQLGVPTAEQRAGAEAARNRLNHVIWDTIHRLAIAGQLTDAKLDEILKALPCGTCGADFAAIRKADPLPAEPAGQFETSWRWHNAVNARLGKPLVTLQAAAERYRGGGGSVAAA